MRAKTEEYKITRGFTLIELLVVMAIITVLLSMLMPSLKAAKEKSRQVVCNTNLHSLLTSWEMYSLDNNYELCPPFTGGLDGIFVRSWVDDGHESSSLNFRGGTELAIRNGLLWQYVENLKVYHCPTDKSKRLRSYSLSFSMGGGFGLQPGTGIRISIRNGIIPVTKTPGTTGKLVFIDAEPRFLRSPWIAGSFVPIKADFREWYRMNTRSDMTARHSGGCNLSFADGSCRSWNWKNLSTISFITDKTIFSQGAVGNEDYEMIRASLDVSK